MKPQRADVSASRHLRDEKTQTTSYPRMVTKMNKRVSVRSVVHRSDREADLEKIGTPQLDWCGTILNLTPSRKAGKIMLTGDLGLSSHVGEHVDDLNGGNEWPIYEGVRLRIDHATLEENDTLVVGPVRRPAKKGESEPDLWVLLTLSAKTDDMEHLEALHVQRQMAPKEAHYQFTDTKVEDLIRFVAGDARLERYIIAETGELPLVSLDMKAAPLDVLLRVCEKAVLQMKKSGRYWVIGGPGAAMPMMVAGEAAKKLRGQAEQQYDFSKAQAGDVLRFLMTDMGVPFISLPDDAPEAKRLLTFSVKDSPFGAVEALCGTLRLNLLEVNGVWHVRRGAAAPLPQTLKKAPSKTTSLKTDQGTEHERVRDTLLRLPAGGRKLDENGHITSVMLGDMVLQPGSVLPPLIPGQKGNMRVLRIEKDHIAFSWKEPNGELPPSQLVLPLK